MGRYLKGGYKLIEMNPGHPPRVQRPNSNRLVCPVRELNRLRELLCEVREAIADYKYAEGCGCCRDHEHHEKAEARLSELLEIPKYSDESGYDWAPYRTS